MAEPSTNPVSSIIVEQSIITSEYLERDVIIDIYLPAILPEQGQLSLLMINDGQDLVKMPFDELLDELIGKGIIQPIACVGIHCGPERKMEYGTAYSPDYKGRGTKAGLYTKFIFDELIPFIRKDLQYSFL
jgi:enterochelin esterase-like enzyme